MALSLEHKLCHNGQAGLGYSWSRAGGVGAFSLSQLREDKLRLDQGLFVLKRNIHREDTKRQDD
jgi:hypothetical protein